ncbi:MAG: four helix bundle protein [bacterium]|nr:four helix bundle protein [bacterium]MDZ4296499.1 four helix bundle protein [Patescibacteria group bacterium]
MDQFPSTRYRSPLDERTLLFAKRVITLAKALPVNTVNHELISQVTRSGTSVGANYREANDALSKKDFLHRLRITRKEAKETMYWLDLIIHANQSLKERIVPLREETRELIKILSSIIEKSKTISGN